ncbi:hypothetical protein CTAYLR_008340 [Chrysophaeum taylorii]|uniref:Uncharacterized protein n=1 Tax=Chrysophaeum taylorii TaxID=2483200 RepID=A0AAD7XI99_9STRA|nr:hypothetical protein CTAYLR_008340 [Chrysophaeum taylorii]
MLEHIKPGMEWWSGFVAEEETRIETVRKKKKKIKSKTELPALGAQNEESLNSVSTSILSRRDDIFSAAAAPAGQSAASSQSSARSSRGRSPRTPRRDPLRANASRRETTFKAGAKQKIGKKYRKTPRGHNNEKASKNIITLARDSRNESNDDDTDNEDGAASERDDDESSGPAAKATNGGAEDSVEGNVVAVVVPSATPIEEHSGAAPGRAALDANSADNGLLPRLAEVAAIPRVEKTIAPSLKEELVADDDGTTNHEIAGGSRDVALEGAAAGSRMPPLVVDSRDQEEEENRAGDEDFFGLRDSLLDRVARLFSGNNKSRGLSYDTFDRRLLDRHSGYEYDAEYKPGPPKRLAKEADGGTSLELEMTFEDKMCRDWILIMALKGVEGELPCTVKSIVCDMRKLGWKRQEHEWQNILISLGERA